MNIEDYSAEELAALEEQTNAIAANLKYIEEHNYYQGETLETVEEQTNAIAANLKYIEEHEVYQKEDFEELDEEPVTALRAGWDDYVRFAAARPRLYAAMMSRVLQGAQIPAAQQAFTLLIERIATIEAQGRLALTVGAAADLMWASANAASLLFVTAQLRNTAPPTTDVLEDIRENAVGTILTPESEG